MNHRVIKLHILTIIITVYSMEGVSQVLYPGSDLIDYYKVLELKNANIDQRINMSPNIMYAYAKDSLKWNPWEMEFVNTGTKKSYFDILPIAFTNSFNSKYPRGYNDGAVWQGKGLTSSIQGGFTGKYGKLEFTFAPVMYFSQNSNFSLSPDRDLDQPFKYAYNNNIDYVQRYGDTPFVGADWGQSDIRMVFNWFTIGASTQNMVWGPAQVNPILMSNQAAGIPHIDLGTNKPVQTKIGSFEMKVFWGLLSESDYFDDDEENNHRYWTGASVGYSPSFIKGLYLGINRAFYKKGREFEVKDLFISIWTFESPDESIPETGNDEYDQMGSATIRWSFSEVGFESYFEMAKNDFGGGYTGNEPEHARAYTLGFIKLVELDNDHLFKLTYEHTSLDKAKTAAYKKHNAWYAHNYVKQGYTNNGQVIGGGIGPGSTTDNFGIRYYFPLGKLSVSAQRIRFDDDYFFDNINNKELHDHEWTGILGYTRNIGNNRINAKFGFSFRENIYYQLGEDVFNISASINWTHTFQNDKKKD